MAVCMVPLVVGAVVLDDDDEGVLEADDVAVAVEVAMELDVELGVMVLFVTTVDWTTMVVVGAPEDEEVDDEVSDDVTLLVIVTVEEAAAVGNTKEVGLETVDTVSDVLLPPPRGVVVTAFGHSIAAPFPAMNAAIKLSGAYCAPWHTC